MKKTGIIIFGLGAIAAVVTGVTFGLKGALFVDKDLLESKNLSDAESIEEAMEKDSSEKIERGEREIIDCDVLVVGAGTGGMAAAIASSREGAKTCLFEETDWLGGMLSAAGVPAIDGRSDTPSGIFREFIDRVESYYASKGMSDEIHNCQVSYLCFEPHIADETFKEMADEEENLSVFYNSKAVTLYRDGDRVVGAKFVQNDEKTYVVNAKVTIDATEFGDLMYLGDIPYDLGIDANSDESLANVADTCIQPITYVAILQQQNNAELMEEPPNYNRENYRCTIKSDVCPDSNSKFDMKRLLSYGRMPNNKLMINIPSHSYGNDFHATSSELEELSRAEVLEEAKNYSRGFIYFMQTELGLDNYGLYDEFDTEDKFAKMPYIRESRRLKGEYRLTESDVVKGGGGQRADVFYDAIAIGDYPIDLHFCKYGIGDVFKEIAPYQIPYRVTIPEDIDGFMAADKNISVSHIVNGTTRLQPVTMSVGQAVGTAAGMASNQGIEPRDIDVEELQRKLISAKSNLFFFKDLTPEHFAYSYVAHLAIKGMLSGYEDFTFKPNDTVNESDLLKVFRVYLTFKNQDESLLESIDLEDGSQTKVKRSDMAKYMYNLLNGAAKIDQSNTTYLDFEDIETDSELYEELSHLVAIDIFSNNTAFRPSDPLSRAEAVTLIGRAFDTLFAE